MNSSSSRIRTPLAFPGAIAAVGTVALFQIGVLFAQVAPTDTIEPSACGSGRATLCGTETTYRCTQADPPTPFNLGPMGGYSFRRPDTCEPIDRRNLYRDTDRS